MKFTWIFAVVMATLVILVQSGSSLDAPIRIPVLRQARQSDDQKPEVQKPEIQKPDDQKPDDQKPDDQKPVAEKPADQKPEAEKPADQKPDDQKPTDQKPEVEKPADQKPVDQKPADKNPGDQKPDTELPAKRPITPLVDDKLLDHSLDSIDPLVDVGNGLEIGSRPKPPPMSMPAKPPPMGRNGDYPDLPIANPTPAPPKKPDESDAEILPGGNVGKKPSTGLEVPTPPGGYPTPSGGYPETSGGYPASIGGYSSPSQKYGPVSVPDTVYGQRWPTAPYLQNSWSSGWGEPRKHLRKKGRKNKGNKKYGHGWPSREDYWNSAEVELEFHHNTGGYNQGHPQQYTQNYEGQGHRQQYGQNYEGQGHRQQYGQSHEGQGHRQRFEREQTYEGQGHRDQHEQSYEGHPGQYEETRGNEGQGNRQTGGGANELEWEDDNSNAYTGDDGWENNPYNRPSTPDYNGPHDGGRKFDDGSGNSNYNAKNHFEEIGPGPMWQGNSRPNNQNYNYEDSNTPFKNFENPNYGNHVQRAVMRPGPYVQGMYGFRGTQQNHHQNSNARPSRAQNSEWPDEMRNPNGFFFQSRLPSTSQLYENLGFNDLW